MKNIFYVLVFLVSFQGVGQEQIIGTNVKAFPDIMREWRDGAKYYKVDYKTTLRELKAVKFVDTVPTFIGEYRNGVILLNQDLEHLKNLTRVIIFNQLGNLFGLEDDDIPIIHIMSNRFEIGYKHEYYSEMIRQRTSQRVKYFQKLAQENQYEKEI